MTQQEFLAIDFQLRCRKPWHAIDQLILSHPRLSGCLGTDVVSIVTVLLLRPHGTNEKVPFYGTPDRSAMQVAWGLNFGWGLALSVWLCNGRVPARGSLLELLY